MKKTICKLIISTCLIIAVAITAFGQAGSLDLTFGTGGKVITAVGIHDDFGNSTAIQIDGKIVVAGQTQNGLNNDFAIVRYNYDGTLDSTFDSDGIDTTDFGNSDDNGASIAIMSDGKIVVAGATYHYALGWDFAVARYNTNGSLDNSFGSGGKVITDFGNSVDIGNSVLIQSDGKIVVAGYSNSDFALARYNSDGTLDSTFDADGKATTDFGVSDEEGRSVAIQIDGKIVVGGFIGNVSDYDFALVRYNSDGSLDNSFDVDGKVTTDFGSVADLGFSVAIQSDGKIVLVGRNFDGFNSFNFALVRYNNNGTLDNSFGIGGQVLTDINMTEAATSVVILSDGKILMGGFTFGFTHNDFALLRYNSNGSLDSTFDFDGIITTDFMDGDDASWSITIESDGKIVLTGSSRYGAHFDFAIARYNCFPVGISENTTDKIIITPYPNPFDNQLIIKGTKEKREVIIFNMLGKEIMRQHTSGAETKINTEILPRGVYLLNYIEGNKTANIKLIKL